MSEDKKVKGRPPKYPWLLAEVGDFFELPYNRRQGVIYVCKVNRRHQDRKFQIVEGEDNEVLAKRIS